MIAQVKRSLLKSLPPEHEHPRLLCCPGSSSTGRIFPSSLIASPSTSSCTPRADPSTARFASAAPKLGCSFGLFWDPCREQLRKKFSVSALCPGGILLLVLPWGAAHWRQSCLQTPSYQDLLHGAAGWASNSAGEPLLHPAKQQICLTTAFSLSHFKYSCFFPGKQKKRCVPEELPRTRDLQLHPGVGWRNFPCWSGCPAIWGLQGNIKNKSRALHFLPFFHFYSLFCHALVWIFEDEELLGVHPALPARAGV